MCTERPSRFCRWLPELAGLATGVRPEAPRMGGRLPDMLRGQTVCRLSGHYSASSVSLRSRLAARYAESMVVWGGAVAEPTLSFLRWTSFGASVL